MLDWCIRQDNVHRFVDGKVRTDLILVPSIYYLVVSTGGDARLATLSITTCDLSKQTTLGRSNRNVKNALTTARFRPSTQLTNTISCRFSLLRMFSFSALNLNHASQKFSSHNEGERAGTLDVNRQMLGCIHGRIKQLAKRAPTVFAHKLLEIYTRHSLLDTEKAAEECVYD